MAEDDQGRDEAATGQPGEAAREGGPGSFVKPVVQRGARFSREVVATMIGLASAAFGVVAALAWNSAITAWFNDIFPNEGGRVSALFVYAVVVTLIGVVVIVSLGRLSARLKAEPVFKYPSPPKQA